MNLAVRNAAYSGLALALAEVLARWKRNVPMAADERERVYAVVPHVVSMVGHFRPDVDTHPGGKEAARAVGLAGHRAANVLQWAQCRFPETVALRERVLAIYRALHGGDQAVHADVSASLNNLASACRWAGNFSAARQHYEGSLAMKSKLHGNSGKAHQSTATSLNNLAELCRSTGDLTSARRYFEAALAMRRQLFGTVHAKVADSLHGLASVCMDAAGARENYTVALEMYYQVFGGANAVRAEIAGCLHNLGRVCYKEGKLDQAREWFEKSLGMQRLVHGGPEAVHDDIRKTLSWLGRVALEQGELPLGAAWSREALVMACNIYGAEHQEAVNEKTWLDRAERAVAASVSGNEETLPAPV